MILLVSILGMLIGYSAACLGCGSLAFRILTYRSDFKDKLPAGVELAMSFALGQGLLANLWLLLALRSWFIPSVVIGVVVPLALFGVISTRRQIADFTHQVSIIWHELRSDSWGWQAMAGLTVLICLAWATSFGRRLTPDAGSFYMAWPKVIAASHRLVPLPDYEGDASFGLQGEMHYAALMAMGSPNAARLFAWPTILAGAVILLALGRQIGLGRRGQWIALAMIFTSSAAIMLSGDGKTDLFAVPLGLAAYYWLLKVRNGSPRVAWWLVGLFSGLAIVAKASYLPVMAPGIVVLMTWDYQDDLRDPAKWKHALISISTGGIQALAGLLVAIVPHLIQNAVLFHNPLSPFGSGTMGWLKENWYAPDTTRRIVSTYPLALTFGNYWAQYGDLSPLVLAFLPLAVLLPRPRPITSSPLVAVTVAALVGLLTWILLEPSVLAPRYILAVLLLFSLLAARAAEYVCSQESKPRVLTFSVMAAVDATIIVVGLYWMPFVFAPLNTYHYLTGYLSDCGRDLAQCEAMAAINKLAEPGDRVFLQDYSRYWLRADLIQCVSTTPEVTAIVKLQNSEARWESFYRQGFRFILTDKEPSIGYPYSLDLANPPAWLKIKEIYVDESGTLKAYRVEAQKPPVKPSKACRQVNPPAWDLVSLSNP